YPLKEGEIRLGHPSPLHEQVLSLAFKDIYSIADCRESYYQQRWQATEVENSPYVSELLSAYQGCPELNRLLELFGCVSLLDKRLIFLSSGELRKFLILRALLRRPRLLVLDNPFIGLDAASRKLLVELFEKAAGLEGLQLVLLLADPRDIPAMITHVLPVYDRQLLPPCRREAFLADEAMQARLFPDYEMPAQLPASSEVEKKEWPPHRVTMRMEQVCVRYGKRLILDHIDWEVLNGEKWALLGPNGSGKSTLLSLVCADNPQAYANSIYLFDRKRGSGESIWDIKRRIGYVSPEMHLYCRDDLPLRRFVAGGFFEAGSRKTSPEQEAAALAWMKAFRMECLQERRFQSLSSGEQRLALLARAFVKQPDLLVLDEPLHGLDLGRKRQAARLIGQYGSQPGKTLIYVTHYAEEIPSCVTRQFRLKKIAEA
ncbi:MAG: ATP-binding cassette domain-containing protein, partial [Tannerella sp.]|nr:ATP-binding cassette domain-containing protein [Tannerella sp.]